MPENANDQITLQPAKRTSKAKKPLAAGKILKLTNKDRGERNRLANKIVKGLKDIGDYDPRLDNFLIDKAARAIIYMEKLEKYLDKPEQDPTVIQAITDAMSKQGSILRWTVAALAANRKERLAHKTQREIESSIQDRLNKLIRSE